MLRFTAYIEYLLMTRHYCYVPGHGAYMLADEPAQTGLIPSIGEGSSRVHTLEAPHRIVHFSPLHTHDDGILAQLLMESEGMTYDEACHYIQRQVEQLPAEMADAPWADIDTDNFGFDSLRLETWSDIEARRNGASAAAANVADSGHDTVSIPRVWLQRAAMLLLVVLFWFTDFIGLRNGGTQLASVIDVAMMQRTTSRGASRPADIALYPAVTAAAEAPAVQMLNLTPGTSITPDKQVTATHYYIVVATLTSEQKARSLCQSYAGMGFDQAGVLAKRKLYRVFAASFTDRDEAVQYLRELRRRSPRFENAWLLPLNEESLSYIIKKKYNDNQLSMELSHPNQRTERDQG